MITLIIGDPGSGKSVLAQALRISLIKAQRTCLISEPTIKRRELTILKGKKLNLEVLRQSEAPKDVEKIMDDPHDWIIVLNPGEHWSDKYDRIISINKNHR